MITQENTCIYRGKFVLSHQVQYSNIAGGLHGESGGYNQQVNTLLEKPRVTQDFLSHQWLSVEFIFFANILHQMRVRRPERNKMLWILPAKYATSSCPANTDKPNHSPENGASTPSCSEKTKKRGGKTLSQSQSDPLILWHWFQFETLVVRFCFVLLSLFHVI